jgi:ATP-dependent DNA helicase RecQ
MKITGFARAKIRTAVELIDRQGAWDRVPQRDHYGLIRFRKGTDAIREYARNLDNRALAAFVRAVLRLVHADAFSEWWRLDLRSATRRVGLSRDRLNRGLAYLEERGFLHWQPPGDALQVELAFPRSGKLPVDDRGVQSARQRAETRLQHMLRYARSVSCRRHFLLTYFGEASAERCGACDVCLDRHEPTVVTPDDEPVLRTILQRMAAGTPRRDWFDDPPVPRHRIEALVNWLAAEEYVTMEAPLDGRYALTEKGEDALS